MKPIDISFLSDKEQIMLYFTVSILPAVITAVISVVSIFVQAVMSCKSNKNISNNLVLDKKLNSITTFYYPLSMKISELELFYVVNENFKFDVSKLENVAYKKQFSDVQDIYKGIKFIFENDFNFFPLSEELNGMILKIQKTSYFVTQPFAVITNYNNIDFFNANDIDKFKEALKNAMVLI